MKRSSYRRLALIPCVLLALVGVFAIPLLAGLVQPRVLDQVVHGSEEGWGSAFLRAALFALVSALIEVFAGFLVAVSLRKASPSVGQALVLLLGPPLMGSVALGFVAKLNLLDCPLIAAWIADRSWVPTWGLMLAIQCWQFLPLSIYLFWLHLQAVPAAVEEFSIAARLRPLERLRDVYWPHCHNLAILLALFGVLQGLQEFAKFHVMLRASAGTGMELAGHWLLRHYSKLAPNDPVFATDSTLAYCGVFIAVGLLTAIAAVLIVDKGGKAIAVALARIRLDGTPRTRWANGLAVFVVAGSYLPLWVLGKYVFRRHFIDWDQFARSVVFTLLALFVVLGVSLLFGIASRLTWPQLLERFERRSLVFFAGVFFLLFIPPIGLAFCGYRWLAACGQLLQSPLVTVLLWLVGQTILAFPLLTAFVLYNHFRVRTAEIQLQEAAGATPGEVAAFSFLSRFRLENLLVALFGFSVIWNESTLNSIMSGLSRGIPSAALELTQRVEGRDNAYFEGANLIMVSFIPMALGMMLWAATKRRPSSLNGGVRS